MKATWLDGALVWVALMGVWPLANPAHDGGTILSALDLAIHVAATMVLLSRWTVVRR